MNQQTETIIIPTESSVIIQGTIHSAKINLKGVLIYFHGGGLIYGHRNDLPDPYIQKITQTGYTLISIDYLLAPETKLDIIHKIITTSLTWLFDNTLAKIDKPIYFFGRSSGGYLALYQAAHHFNEQISGVISFYGYYTLNDASFLMPNRHYLKYPKVSHSLLEKSVKHQPIVVGSIDQRFPLYLVARQNGSWIDLLIPDNETASNYSLTADDVNSIDSLFLVASAKDPDVPVTQSRRMANMNSNSHLEIINSNEHDFDRTNIEGAGDKVYSHLIAWLSIHN